MGPRGLSTPSFPLCEDAEFPACIWKNPHQHPTCWLPVVDLQKSHPTYGTCDSSLQDHVGKGDQGSLCESQTCRRGANAQDALSSMSLEALTICLVLLHFLTYPPEIPGHPSINLSFEWRN